MRRCVAVGLLLLLVGQSSGAAPAATSDPSGSRVSLLAALVDPVRTAIANSRVYALVTGTENRYGAMHAPAPVIARPTARTDAARLMREERPLRPRIREGIRRMFIMPDRSALDPRHRRLDPLAMRRSRLTPTITRSSSPLPFLEPLRSLVTAPPSGSRGVHPLSPQRGGSFKPMVSSGPTTGIERWWTYEERGVPGIGMAMVNVGTGNFLVTAVDVDVPERGVDLTLRRAYNSQSLHDANGDDGGNPSIFGNRWTSNLDASIVYNSTANTITVHDIDGTACTYTSLGNGQWQPCTGEYATLAPTDSSDCTYAWTKKSGVVYWFHSDNPGPGCDLHAAKVGQLDEILGRNHNNNIVFAYSYDGWGYSTEDITEIDAEHSDGHKLTMTFGLIPGTSINELATLIRPDKAELQYSYDSSGNLVEVDKPGNNSANTVPGGHGVPAGDAPETYGYISGTSTMVWACGPRCTVAQWTNKLNDGAAILFATDSSERLTALIIDGVLNFTPDDGTNTPLQSGSTSFTQWYVANFVYGSGSACSNTESGTTTMCDTDGHSTIWTLDASNRVTQTQVASSNSTTLTTTQTWDGNNNLTSFQNPQEFANGTSTDLSYDANGNITEIKEPQVQTSDGSLRPTVTFTYDEFNNLTSACDAIHNASHSGACPTTPGSDSAVYVYDTAHPDSAEPFGKVTDSYTPKPYHTSYTYNYNSSSEPGDFGLPTLIAGDPFDELDRTQGIFPRQSFSSDSFGNLTAYGEGNGQWAITYDSLNRVTTKADPDGVTSYTCYFADNSIQAKQSALQYQLDGNTRCGSNSVSYLYDTDGDATDEIHHYGNEKGDTTNWYDGLDRLVEVSTPADVNIDDKQPLLARYLYDLTQDAGGGPNLQVGNSIQFHGYGNLYKTQRYVSFNNNSPAWRDANGNAYDVANRSIHRYQYTPTTAASGNTPGTSPGPLEKWDSNYDENNQSGLLTSAVDPGSTQTTYAYNAISYLKSKSFSDSTPTATYTYDPDGHLASASNSVASDTYAYDADGNLQSDSEGTVSDPATFSYDYYPNGWHKTLTVSDTDASYSEVRSYSYRADGLRKTLALSSQANPFTWTYTSAGRLSSQSDPATGSGPFSSHYFTNGVTIGPRTASYDATTGVLSKLTMPDGLVYKSIGYDPEAELTGFTVGAPPGFNEPNNTLVTGVQYTYDKRGELYLTQATGNGPILGNGYVTLVQDQFILGHLQCLTALNGCGGGNTGDGQVGFNAGIDGNTGAAYKAQNGTDSQGCLYSQAISYDANGRDASEVVTRDRHGTCYFSGASVADTRAYDAEDHATDDKCTAPSGYSWICVANADVHYQWGPRGELRVFNAGTKYTLHWDNDDLALTTDPQNNASNYIEALASSNNDQLVMYDRDFSGTTVEQHTKTGDTGATVTPSYTLPDGKYTFANVTGSWPFSGTGGPLVFSTFVPDMPRSDGYLAGKLSIQGARAYDSNISQWITADAHKGDVEDPMSQWAYQWNANNPIANSDSTGYDSCNGSSAHTDQSSSSDPQCIAQVHNKPCDLDCQFNRSDAFAAAILGVGRTSSVYYALQTSSGRPYVGMTYDDRFLRRLSEQAKRGRIIIRAVSGLSRSAARGLEQYLIKQLTLGNLENQINSISESNPSAPEIVGQGLEEAEGSNPGVVQQIFTTLLNAIESLPPILP